jgi:uncharacterized tellurite resistance protein B-like protein
LEKFVSLLRRFLGIGDQEGSVGSESESVRRIAADLESLPPDKAHYLACFAFVLARVAHADLRIEAEEIEAMRRATASLAALSDHEAELVVEIALSQTKELGGSENYLVTREFRKVSTPEQRMALVECLYAISASDGTISTTESAEVLLIANELGLSRRDANALRAGWKEHLAEFQGLAKHNGG